MIIWHNPNCSKSRECIKVLDQMKVVFEIREYLIDKPSFTEIQEVIKMMDISDIRDIMRVKEDMYKELDLDNKDKTSGELVDAMVQYPILIERPLGINQNKAIIGRPLENILELFNV